MNLHNLNNDIDVDWFLAQLKPNCAELAQRNLNRQGFQTFLPTEEDTRPKNGKFITYSRPLFPGYIFVAFNPECDFWRSVNATRGITTLVSFGKKPAVVPSALMQQLMLRCDGAGKLLPPSVLKPGDQVKLTKGPFANFAAQVQQIDPDKRIWLLMDVIGGQNRVSVTADQLRLT